METPPEEEGPPERGLLMVKGNVVKGNGILTNMRKQIESDQKLLGMKKVNYLGVVLILVLMKIKSYKLKN